VCVAGCAQKLEGGVVGSLFTVVLTGDALVTLLITTRADYYGRNKTEGQNKLTQERPARPKIKAISLFFGNE
jgi:hypothetical protein